MQQLGRTASFGGARKAADQILPVFRSAESISYRQPPEMMQLNEKVRKLESELSGTYKENQVSTMQVLELTRKIQELENAKRDTEAKLQAAQEYNEQSATIINEKVILS